MTLHRANLEDLISNPSLVLGREWLQELLEVTRDPSAAADRLERLAPDLSPREREQAQQIVSAWRAADTAEPWGDLQSVSRYISARWDMRLGHEREVIPTSRSIVPDEWAEVIARGEADLGMSETTTASGDFDCVVILGGLARANYVRPEYAARLYDSGAITTPLVVGLAGERMLSVEERRICAELGSIAMHERRSLAAGVSRAFNAELKQFTRGIAPDAPATQLVHLGRLTLLLATAPRGSDGARPPARSTLEWLLTNVELADLQRVLCVTSPLYRPQNHLDALEAFAWAGIDAEVVTVGSNEPPPGGREDLRQVYQPQHYLQEIKAFIDALARRERSIEETRGRIGPAAVVSDSVQVLGRARVAGSAMVVGNSRVSGSAYVGGRSLVSDRAVIDGSARVVSSAEVEASARIEGAARVGGRARIVGEAAVGMRATVSGRAWVGDHASVSGSSRVMGDVVLGGSARVDGDAVIDGYVVVEGNVRLSGSAQIIGLHRPTPTPHLTHASVRTYGITLRGTDPAGALTIDDDALLAGSVIVRGNARIYGRAMVSGLAVIADDADLYEPHHVQVIQTLSGPIVTVYRARTPSGSIDHRIVRGQDPVPLSDAKQDSEWYLLNEAIALVRS